MPRHSTLSNEEPDDLLPRVEADPASAKYNDVAMLFDIVRRMPGMFANIWDSTPLAVEIHKWREPFNSENVYTDIQYRNELGTRAVKVLSEIWGQSRTAILMHPARTAVIKTAAHSMHPPLAEAAQTFLKRLEEQQFIPPPCRSLLSQFAHLMHGHYLAKAHGS